MEREPTIWETYLPDTSDKGLISKIYEELIQLHTRKTNNPIKNGQRAYTDTSPRRIYRGPIDRHVKQCSTSLAIREMQIKTIIRYHFTPVRNDHHS